MSFLGIFNFVILQWFFIRLAKIVKSEEDHTVIGWKIIGPILPLTGWWSNYVWAKRKKRDAPTH